MEQILNKEDIMELSINLILELEDEKVIDEDEKIELIVIRETAKITSNKSLADLLSYLYELKGRQVYIYNNYSNHENLFSLTFLDEIQECDY